MVTDSLTFLTPQAVYPIEGDFDYDQYIETERELWALFPESENKRATFVQIGLSAFLYVESITPTSSELLPSEAYFLLPCEDNTLRPVKMYMARRLTLSEYRMGHYTAMKLSNSMSAVEDTMCQAGVEILGDELVSEMAEHLLS